MVIISDGSLEYDAPLWIEVGFLICLYKFVEMTTPSKLFI